MLKRGEQVEKSFISSLLDWKQISQGMGAYIGVDTLAMLCQLEAAFCRGGIRHTTLMYIATTGIGRGGCRTYAV